MSGLATIDRALERAERNEERWYIAELLRIKGELMLRACGPSAEAEAERLFAQSLDWARRQGARSWELRTSISPARLPHETSRMVQAREQLASVYARFGEGFATADLSAARTLLGML